MNDGRKWPGYPPNLSTVKCGFRPVAPSGTDRPVRASDLT